MKKEKGQVSIETLLLAGIIIMLSISTFGYYTRIMDSTIALETIEIEALKQLDAEDNLYFIKEIGYKIDAGTAYFCIMLEPGDDVLNMVDMSAVVVSLTNYEAGALTVTQNSMFNCS